MSVNDRMTGLLGQLDQSPYQSNAAELIRFRADDNDDLVAGVVRSVVADGEDGGDLFRRGINDEAIDTLRLFAMRRVLLGRRLSSLGPIYEALDACALIPGERDVPWDSWVKGALFIARGIGGDLDSMVQRFVDLHPERQARCDVVLESMDRVHELAQCRLAEVSTTYGVGLLETLAFLGRPTFGVWGAPRQADNYVSYAPTTNLAQLCVSLADALEASKKVTVGPIGQDQLAAILFSQTTPGSYVATNGCLSFVAEDVAGSSLTALVAELTSDEDPAALALDAQGFENQVAESQGSRLIVLSPQPSFSELDVVIDAAEFKDFVSAALLEPTAR